MTLFHVSLRHALKPFACMLFFLCILLFSCKKGDTGPAGPAGPTGVAGPTGPVGAANVITSAWTYATNLKDTTIDASALKIGTVAAPQIVDSILNNGLVLVYFTFGSGTFPLPYESNAGGATSIMSFLPQRGRILITRFTLDNSGSVPLSTGLEYRYIIIPGGKATASFAQATQQGHATKFDSDNTGADYSKMSYEEVCQQLKIQP